MPAHRREEELGGRSIVQDVEPAQVVAPEVRVQHTTVHGHGRNRGREGDEHSSRTMPAVWTRLGNDEALVSTRAGTHAGDARIPTRRGTGPDGSRGTP